MKPTPTLLAASALLAMLGPTAAQAEDSILTFELAPPQWADQQAEGAAAEALTAPPLATAPADAANAPLPIPAQAANPPMRYHSPQQLPAGVYRRGVAVALNDSTSATALLPPAPPLPTAVLVAAAPPPEAVSAPDPEPAAPEPVVALDFGMEPSAAVLAARAELAAPKPVADPLPRLFDGNSDSLVAWAVGSAEGTRTPNGAINPAYFGHTDPGNRVWNMGTFSYQHGAQTPAEADQKQLARLSNQGQVLRRRALKHGLNLTLEETLNGLDLANQSPLAAIGEVGYIERLAEAKAQGLEGSEAILVARTRSYINPKTGRWNAPGLGNTEPSIRRDQKRRADAVASAIAAYEAQNPQLQAQSWTLVPAPEAATPVEPPTEPVDGIFRVWTSPSDPIAQAEPVTDEAVAAQAVADEAVAAAPAEEVAPQTDRLAALWQTTVDRFSDSFTSTGTGQTPQTASIAGLLFNGNGAAPQAPSATEVATAEVAAAEVAPEPQPAAIAPTDAAEGHAPPALEPPTVEAPIEAPAADPVALAEAEASSSPTWAAAREGHQSTPAPQAEAVPGAFPDSTVFAPASQSPEAVPELSPEAEPQPEPAEPAAAGPVAPEAEAAASEVPAPEAQSEQPAAEPASAGASATQPEPEPAASDILGFAPANADELLPKPALAAETPIPTVEPVPAAAATPLASQPADPAADPAPPAQGIDPAAPADEPAQ